MKRLFMAIAVLTAVVACLAEVRAGESAVKKSRSRPFYPYDNGTGRGEVPLDQQAAMLKELGYDGIGYTGTQRIPEMLRELDARGLKMYSIYVGSNVDERQTPYDPGLAQAVEQLRGRETVILLNMRGGTPSSDALDGRAVAMLREIGAMAAKSGLRVALYPHVDMYVARVKDAIRLARKVDRPNVGVTFNMCHFLKTDGQRDLESQLKECKPWLFAVSINGADGGDTQSLNWRRLILRLDQGTFDVGRVLRTLDAIGYTGPVGLQCYRVPGDRRENLRRSMEAWRRLTSGFSRTEDVAFTAAADRSTQRYVVMTPVGFKPEESHDVLITLHGHGSDRWQFVKDARDECRAARDVAAAHRMLFVSPDYRAPSSWMGPEAEADMLQMLDELKARFRIGKVVVCGASMGGASALTFTAMHPARIDGVVSMNGTANHVEYGEFQDAISGSFGGTKAEAPEQYRKRSAEFWPDRFTMPIAITAGGKDAVVPAESVLRLASAVKQRQPDVLLVYRDNGGHNTSYRDAVTAIEFVVRKVCRGKGRT